MKAILVQNDQETIKVAIRDIYYIKAHPLRPHYVQLVTKMGNYDVRQQLQTLEEDFCQDFARCHRGCLVNLSQIKSINLRQKVLLLGDDGAHEVTFSRRRYQNLLQKWLKKGEE